MPRVKVGGCGPRRSRKPINSGQVVPSVAIAPMTKPNCTNYSRSNQKYQWHNLKLSWPHANDRRRAIVSKSSPPSPLSPTEGRISDARFVHTTHWDIELSHNLIGSVPVRSLSWLDPSTCWNPSEMETLDSDLLEYCMLPTSLPSLLRD